MADATNTRKTRLQMLRGTAEDLENSSEKLREGELLVYLPDEDNAVPKIKIGDGSDKSIRELPFITDELDQKIDSSTTYDNNTPLINDIGGILAKNHPEGFENVPLNTLITELLYPYVPPEINSFILTPRAGTYEKCAKFTVTKATVEMTKKSKNIESVTFYQPSNMDRIITDNIQKTMSEEFTHIYSNTDKIEYTVYVSDGTTSVQVNAGYTFYNGVYYGVASESTVYDSSFVNGLTKTIRGNKLPTFTVEADANQYIYYCLPTSYGTCTFAVNGFTGGFSLVDIISFTNASGYTEDYYIYKSDEPNLGSTTVNVA